MWMGFDGVNIKIHSGTERYTILYIMCPIQNTDKPWTDGYANGSLN